MTGRYTIDTYDQGSPTTYDRSDDQAAMIELAKYLSAEAGFKKVQVIDQQEAAVIWSAE